MTLDVIIGSVGEGMSAYQTYSAGILQSSRKIPAGILQSRCQISAVSAGPDDCYGLGRRAGLSPTPVDAVRRAQAISRKEDAPAKVFDGDEDGVQVAIPRGCVGCGHKAECFVEKRLRLCMGGDLHSDVRVGSAESLEIRGRFVNGIDYEMEE